MSADEDSIRSVTRADIESRVGANARQSKSRNSDGRFSRNNNLAHAATGTSRETRMLGGQLGSVSKKRKIVQSSKLSWWILGIFIVLIAVALIIPNPGENNTISNAVEGKLPGAPEPDAIYRESRVDETVDSTAQPEASFVRTDDLGRVQAYAEQERITTVIQDSLVQANALESSGNLSVPADNNAASLYQRVLELEPSNSEATQGISRILATLLTNASEALSKGDRPTAEGILQRMQRIDSENRRTLSLENALDQYQNQQAERTANIAELLQSAEVSLGDGKIIEPNRDSALFYYQQVLSIDSANALAHGGIEQIVTQQLGLASQSILESDLDAAISRLNRVESLSPDNPSLALLRAQIAALTATPLPESQTADRAETSQPEADNVWRIDALPSSTNTGPSTETEAETTASAAQAAELEAIATLESASSSEASVIETESVETQTTSDLVANEADMATGLQHYYHGRYDEAYQALKPLADRGVTRAQFRLAVMQQLGRGTAKNESAAEDLFRRTLPAIRASAEAGADWAQADLASLYEDGMVVGQDIERAFSWYLRSAEQGYSGAQTNLGTLYYYGRGVARSREKAIEWYRAAADQGDLVARENLSKLGVK